MYATQLLPDLQNILPVSIHLISRNIMGHSHFQKYGIVLEKNTLGIV